MQCGAPWSQGSVVFEDANMDGRLNAGESVLRVTPARAQAGAIYWRSFGNRAALVFTPHGYTDNQSGSFTLCPLDGDPALARQVVVNRTGRVRLSRDRNGDGVFEDGTGKPLRC